MPDGRPVIAHVLHRLDRAGAEVLAAGLSRALRERFAFTFICLDALGPLMPELLDSGFTCRQLNRRPGIDRKLARSLRKALIEQDAALIHAHQYTPFFYSALSRGLCGRHHRTPILFTEHGRHYPDRRSTKRVLANKLLLRRRDRVTAVGAYVRDALINNEGIHGQRIEVVYNGIDPGPEPADADRAAARERLGIDPGRAVVMQVARFHPVKDHTTAVRAFAKLRDALGGTHDPLLVLVGDGDERGRIQALVKELKLESAVLFTGAVGNARGLIPAADVCILSSLSEGISVTLLEAMAAGKPVVATDVGGNPEVVAARETGLLAPRGDHQALADGLAKILRNPAMAREYALAGRNRLLERFTADRMHAAYARIYEPLIGDSHG